MSERTPGQGVRTPCLGHLPDHVGESRRCVDSPPPRGPSRRGRVLHEAPAGRKTDRRFYPRRWGLEGDCARRRGVFRDGRVPIEGNDAMPAKFRIRPISLRGFETHVGCRFDALGDWERGRLGRGPRSSVPLEVVQDMADDGGVDDESEEYHFFPASTTGQRVDLVDTVNQLSPSLA